MKQILKKILPNFVRKGLHNSLNRTRKIWYNGNEHYCICCDRSYSKFLDMKEGSHPRKGVTCPGCGSAERHRMLLRYLMTNEAAFFPKGSRVLYIAPMFGIRKYLKQLEGVNYLGADLDSSLADVHFDLQDIPYPDASFDFCICSHTLAHVKDDGLALKELNRVLGKDGILLVLERTYPNASTHDMKKVLTDIERLKEYDQVDRWRIYGQDFKDYLASFGFEVDVLEYGRSLSAEQLEREVIDVEDLVYFCRKG